MLNFLQRDPSNPVDIQDTEFTRDLLGRYVCSTFDEAVNNGGRPFDVVVIGGGMFGAYAANRIYRKGADQNLRVLLLDAGGYLARARASPTSCSNSNGNTRTAPTIPVCSSASPTWTARIQTIGPPQSDQSYEIQIDPRGYNSEKAIENDPLRSTGAIYNINAPIRTDVAKGPWQWNTFVIEAVGSRIKVTLNDVVVNDFTDPRPRSLRGHIALQNHHDASKVQFRNIRIKAVVPGVTELPVARVA